MNDNKKERLDLSQQEYDYLALKAADIAGTKLSRFFGFLGLAVAIAVAFGINAQIQNRIDQTISVEVARYLETQGGEQVTKSIRNNVDFVKRSLVAIDNDLASIEQRSSAFDTKVKQIISLLSHIPIEVDDSSMILLSSTGNRIGFEWGVIEKMVPLDGDFIDRIVRPRPVAEATFQFSYESNPNVFITGGTYTPAGRAESGYLVSPVENGFSLDVYGERASRFFLNDNGVGWLAIGVLSDEPKPSVSGASDD